MVPATFIYPLPDLPRLMVTLHVLLDQVIQRLMNDAQVEEIKRHFGVVTESLRSDIRQIAEGHSGIRCEIQDLREEFRDEFKEMRARMRLSFS
jgi:hypothetical protein